MSEDPFDLPPEILQQVPLLAEIAKVLSWSGGPVNWDLARQLAVAVASQGGAGVEPTAAGAEELREDVRVAELWLAEATGLETPPTMAKVQAVGPAGWASRATDVYRELVDPLAHRVTAAMREQGPESGPPETAMIQQAMAQLAPMFLGMQSGVMLGTLARGVLSQYDVPVHPAEEGSVVIVLPAVDAFAESYGLDRREARLYTALHESAHRFEFEGASWVGAHFFALYHNYVSALELDLGGLAERLQGLDVTDPGALREALEGQSLFGAESDATRTALDRVEALLAILEAYAARAVAAALSRLPEAGRISEAAARRRVEESEGERMFRQFVGINLRSERRRQADAFARHVLDAGGWAALNRIWGEADGMPSVEELAAPQDWLRRVG